jgi:predicted phage-related endonuclease
MSREQWLAEREFGLGGSDIGSILMLNKYKASVELFREKIGLDEAPQLSSRFIFFGHRGEDDVLDLGRYYDFSVETKDYRWDEAWLENAMNDNPVRNITPFHYLVVNINYPWIQANVDSLVNFDPKTRMAGNVAEAKNTTIQANKMYKGWVNPVYVCQCSTYALVLEPMLHSPSTMLFQKFDGNQLFGRIVNATEEQWLADDIINESHEFYQNMQQGIEIVENSKSRREAIRKIKDIEPGPDDSERYNKFINAAHSEIEEFSSREGTEDEYDLFADYSFLKSQIKTLTASAREKESILKKVMTDDELSEITWDDGSRIRWKNKFTPDYKGELK